MKKFVLSALVLVLLSVSLMAQGTELGKNEFSFWGGFSPDSATFFPGLGRVPDARFGLVAFRYARRFDTSDTVNLKYTADAVPAAVLSYPDIAIPPGPTTLPVAVRETRYAFGVTPLGLQANLRPTKKYQPYLNIAGGMLIMNKSTPNFGGTRFQFTLDFGGGLEVRLKDRKAVSVGYKFYHISNGYRGLQNPGFDNNVFYVGYTFFSK
jgi:hypothetical protein